MRDIVINTMYDCIERMRLRGIWISADLVEDALREANEL